MRTKKQTSSVQYQFSSFHKTEALGVRTNYKVLQDCERDLVTNNTDMFYPYTVTAFLYFLTDIYIPA